MTNVVCPACEAVNRLPPDKPAAGAKCGRCGQKLFQGRPVEVGEDAFSVHVQRNELPVLVDFWAAWCGPCKMMAPHFQQAAAALEPEVRLLKVDTEQAGGLAAAYGIRSIPTLALFRGGRELARTAGAMELQGLVGWTRQQLGKH